MNPFEALLTDSSGDRQVSPEVLEMLGKQASKMYLDKGVSLNDAIAQLAAQHPELGNEHVKRIVEFANTQTFQHLFQNNDNKHVHFDVADPGVIIRDLGDGGTPSHSSKSLDYQTGPKLEKDEMADVGSGLDELFQREDRDGIVGQGEDIEKNAESGDLVQSLETGQHANPIEDLYDTHQRLQATKASLASGHEHLDLLLKQAHEDFYRTVKQEVLDPVGAGLGGVIGALEKIANKDYLAPVLSKIAARLTKECGALTTAASLEKRAGVVVNPEHPLVCQWAAIEKLATEKVRAQAALEEVESHLSKTAGAIASSIKSAIGVRGKVPAGLRQRFPRI